MAEDNTELAELNDTSAGKCPVLHGAGPNGGTENEDWWPGRLNLKILAKNAPATNPLGQDFDYAAAFSALDLPAVKNVLNKVSPASLPV